MILIFHNLQFSGFLSVLPVTLQSSWSGRHALMRKPIYFQRNFFATHLYANEHKNEIVYTRWFKYDRDKL